MYEEFANSNAEASMAEVRIKPGSLTVGVYDNAGNLLAEIRIPHELTASNLVTVVEAGQSDPRWRAKVKQQLLEIDRTPASELTAIGTQAS
jgi:hypothetical protein